MKAESNASLNLGEGLNFHTYFSFGEEWTDEVNKENQKVSPNKHKGDSKQKKSKNERVGNTSRVTAPANLFKPWFSKGLSERVNRKLASELHNLAGKAEPKPIVGDEQNKVLKVYLSKRAASRENSQRGSSRGSSVMSQSSEKPSVITGKSQTVIDPKAIEDRCKKYYSDYLRVRINKRPSNRNELSSLEESSSQLNPSIFLSKIAHEGSYFHPHLSVNSQDSVDPKKNTGLHRPAWQASPVVQSNIDIQAASVYKTDNVLSAYGFKRRNSSTKLEEKRLSRKLRVEMLGLQAMKSSQSPAGSKQRQEPSEAGFSEKREGKESPALALNLRSRAKAAATQEKKSSLYDRKARPNRKEASAALFQASLGGKLQRFSASNLLASSTGPRKPLAVVDQNIPFPQKTVNSQPSNPTIATKAEDLVLKARAASPRHHLPFGLKRRLAGGSSDSNAHKTPQEQVFQTGADLCLRCPTCGTETNPQDAQIQKQTPIKTQLQHQSRNSSLNKPTLTMIHNLSALTSYMRSRSLES
jgi:hypothetical protein